LAGLKRYDSIAHPYKVPNALNQEWEHVPDAYKDICDLLEDAILKEDENEKMISQFESSDKSTGRLYSCTVCGMRSLESCKVLLSNDKVLLLLLIFHQDIIFVFQKHCGLKMS
jgi:hypothetical protein